VVAAPAGHDVDVQVLGDARARGRAEVEPHVEALGVHRGAEHGARVADEFEEGGVLGSAMIAGAAVGAYPDLRSAAARCVQTDRTFTPNPALATRYNALYALYKDIHARLQAPFSALPTLP
jgi:hypothetical protein